MDSKHSLHSTFREKLIEHLLVGELLKYSWAKGDYSIEISRPEVDRAGYDLIAECNGHIRHIQLKGSHHDATTASQKIQISLTEKPSGCVVWVLFNQDNLELGPFLYFGGGPSEKLPSLDSYKTAKHTKGDSQGVKVNRHNHRIVNKGKFKRINKIEGLWQHLFGDT